MLLTMCHFLRLVVNMFINCGFVILVFLQLPVLGRVRKAFGLPESMGGAAGTAGTAAVVPLLREVRQDKVLPYHILVKKSQTYR